MTSPKAKGSVCNRSLLVVEVSIFRRPVSTLHRRISLLVVIIPTSKQLAEICLRSLCRDILYRLASDPAFRDSGHTNMVSLLRLGQVDLFSHGLFGLEMRLTKRSS